MNTSLPTPGGPSGPYRQPKHGAVGFRGRRYGLLSALLLSFFSADFYRDVAAHWRGLAFGHLAVLLSLTWLVLIFPLHGRFSSWVANDAKEIVTQIPTLSFQNGELSTNVEQPYSVTNEATGDVILVIDTTGAVTTVEEAGAPVLLTRTEAIVQRNPNEVRHYRYEALGDRVIDQDLLFLWLHRIARWLGFVLFPLAVVFSYLYRVVQVAVYAVIGVLFAKMVSANLSYPALVSLAIMAVTPPILLDTLGQTTQVAVPWALSFLMAMAYLLFGVYSNRSAPADGGEAMLPIR